MTSRTVNALMAGVGGQGVLVAGETLALAALAAGLEVKQSEVHGVAQRGGSVVSHVRFGPRVHSPLVPCGDADLLCAAERLEALRYAHYLKPGGTIVMDDRPIQPIRMPNVPESPYPDGVPEFLRGKGYCVIVVPALQEADELGDTRCANTVLLGALSTRLDLTKEVWSVALRERLPERALSRNLRAFEKGRELAGAATASS
jgi:indolepyruvate ferredoxin oxidoreductase beta subunit